MAGLLRPTFVWELDLPASAASRRLAALVGPGGGLEGRVLPGHAVLALPASQRRLSSPWLTIELRDLARPGAPMPELWEAAADAHFAQDAASDRDPPRCQAVGRFSPKPSLWTLMMLSQIALATLVFFALMWAIAQVVLDEAPWALAFAAALGVLMLALVGLARVGQVLAQGQMERLRRDVARALDAGDQAM